MQRKKSRGSKQHTSRNITLGNTLTLTMTLNVLTGRAFQPTGFVVSRTIRKNLRLRNLKMVLPIHFKKLDSLSWSSEVVSDNDFRSAVRVLNSYRLRRAEILGDGYDVSTILCYNSDATSNISTSVSRRIRLRANHQECSCQIHGQHDVGTIDLT
jgi:hypothetical protein